MQRTLIRALIWVPIFLCPLAAEAQQGQRVSQSPTPQQITISSSNVFQQALASASRNNCFLQYTGSNTGYVFFGTTAAATTQTSIQLSAKATVSCSNPNSSIITDPVQVSGTSGDTFVVLQQ